MYESKAYNQSKKMQMLWPIKYCVKVNLNVFFLTCKLSQSSKILSDCKTDFLVEQKSGNVILDCQIKTHDSWVAAVKFLWDVKIEEACMAKLLAQLKKKDITFYTSS